jgi:hypothetical protein
LWLAKTPTGFVNVIANGLYAWIRQGRGPAKYGVTDSLRAGNQFLTGAGAGPAGNFRAIAPDFLKLPAGAAAAEKVQIESDQTKKGYLHVVPGTLGADLGAGLFLKKAGE